MPRSASRGTKRNVRAADAKEVGVGNPAEETCCHPNMLNLCPSRPICQLRNLQDFQIPASPRNDLTPAWGGKTQSVLALQSRAATPKISCPGARPGR